MRSIVVYESFYGNTECVARAVADGLARHGAAQAIKVGEIDSSMVEGFNLLVVGTPTHAWGLPRAKTRAGVTASSAYPSQPLVREWLETLPAGGGRPAAAFDTRLHGPRLLTGSAARGIGRRLRRHGWKPVMPPTSFLVKGTAGPLASGEIERAATWGDELGVRLTASRSSM
jgi:hypothetical protein